MYSPSIHSLTEHIPDSVIHRVAVSALWRPLIFFYKLVCVLSQIIWTGSAGMRWSAILLEYVVVLGIQGPAVWKEMFMEHNDVGFAVNFRSLCVNKVEICFSGQETSAETTIF